jgi:hypothetical protein
MNNYHKYDLIGPKIRAVVTKYKYGSATRLDIVTELRTIADSIEREHKAEANATNQIDMGFK